MKCNHRLDWWSVNNGTEFECSLCGTRLTADEYNDFVRGKQQCVHENTHIVKGVGGGEYTVCKDCGLIL